jgi:ABC-type Fe3+-siderophore transport system permease subunit
LNLFLLSLALILSVAAGAVAIPPLQLLQRVVERFTGWDLMANWPQTFETIVFSIRLPHAVLIILTGSALAGSGAAYQALFRNPLADRLVDWRLVRDWAVLTMALASRAAIGYYAILLGHSPVRCDGQHRVCTGSRTRR